MQTLTGTVHAGASAMRAILVVLLLGVLGCGGAAKKGGGGSTGESRPAVIPMLSELPADPEKRNSILDSANQVAGPEHRKGFTKKERKAETAAATAAAIIGGIFSKTQNVTIGTSTTFDEVDIIAPHTIKPQPVSPRGDGKQGENGETPEGESKPLVPWIKLK
jgi:hypothetical protein